MSRKRKRELRALRRDLGRLIRDLIEDEHKAAEPIGPRLTAHLGRALDNLPIFTERFDDFDLPNVQLTLEALFARPGWGVDVFGVSGQGKRYSMLGLSDLAQYRQWSVGPVEHVNVAVGPGRTLACFDFAVFLVTTPAEPMVAFLARGEEHTPGGAGVNLQVVSADTASATRFLDDVRTGIPVHDVFRGQVLTIEATPTTGRSIVFVERPKMQPDALVLPDGLVERIERHVVGPTRRREMLTAAGRHLGRGLLLWGPPGTGKTHTVRYLTASVPDTTVIILSGSTLGMVGSFGTLARRLAPSLVVLEDVDLIAEERTFGPYGQSGPVLFELMDQMSGQAADGDVAFVLTTNRPDALEPALASRPGRVDLAVEIPLPDVAGRRRLLDLYSRGLEVDIDVDAVVARTEGVTASFIKELLRKAALHAAEAGRSNVTRTDVDEALSELLDRTARLTRVLLGSEQPEQPAHVHEWMRGFPGVAADETVARPPL